MNPQNLEFDQEPAPSRITLRALLLGLATILATFYYVIQIAQRQGSGTYVQAQYPMAAFMPFVAWLFLNILLKMTCPRFALKRGEMLTLFAMTWVVATIPAWIGPWVSILSSPAQFATAENQWAVTIFGHLPWHLFPAATSHVIDHLWYGLPPGMSVPWGEWIWIIAAWLGAAVAVVIFGFCLFILFQKQWQEAEKLTYPLAQMPLDLTAGFDGPRRLPRTFRTKTFWIGFAVVFAPQIYNIVTYFSPGLPPFELFWTYYLFQFEDGLFTGYIRVMPLMLMVIYLCPVDILGSMVLFHWIAFFKGAAMTRFGTPDLGFSGVSAAGRFSEGQLILKTESHGALVFLFLWSLWIARQHLRAVWEQVRTGRGDVSEVAIYRVATIGMVASAACVILFAAYMGVSIPLAMGVFGFMVIAYFMTVKMLAASGIAYIYPDRPFMKGESFFTELIGSIYISPQRLVPFKIFTSYLFFGHFTIPAWPAMGHLSRIFSFRNHQGWVVALVFSAFPVGFIVAAWAMLDLSYDEGGTLFLGERHTWFFDGITYLVQNPTVPNLAKWLLWVGGFAEAGLITLLRARLHWFPIHPIGLIFQSTHAAWWYWINFLLIWIIKMTLLRYGGVRAYLAGKPFFYGLGIGYVVGVILSTFVDTIWFPSAGHRVHWW